MTEQQKSTGPGKFGPQTEAALKTYQRDHGLKDDGILGPKTRKAHKGGTAMPLSVRCQTMNPHEFDGFIDLMQKDPNGKVSYTLVDV